MTEAEVLNKAADLIDERGWCQNHYKTDDGRICAEGAIFMANDADPCDFNWSDSIMQSVTLIEGWLGHALPSWNDHPNRTKDQVTAALRAAAKAVTS